MAGEVRPDRRIGRISGNARAAVDVRSRRHDRGACAKRRGHRDGGWRAVDAIGHATVRKIDRAGKRSWRDRKELLPFLRRAKRNEHLRHAQIVDPTANIPGVDGDFRFRCVGICSAMFRSAAVAERDKSILRDLIPTCIVEMTSLQRVVVGAGEIAFVEQRLSERTVRPDRRADGRKGQKRGSEMSAAVYGWSDNDGILAMRRAKSRTEDL